MSAGSCTEGEKHQREQTAGVLRENGSFNQWVPHSPMRQLVKVYNLKRIALFHDNAP